MTQTMKSMRDGLGVVVVSLAALALAAPVATAGKRVADFFPKTTGSGSLGGQFNEPRGIAVRHSTGQIYVADDNNHRVQRFSADGAFERAWGRNVSASQTSGNDGGNPAFAYEICTTASDCRGGSSTAAVGGFTGSRGGMFDNPQGVAVNQDTGHVYVRDRDNRRVQQFDADGNFIRAWGWDVTAGGSANFEICTVAADCKQATSGNGDGQFGASVGQAAVTGMAIDPTTGDVFVADPGSGAAPVNRRVQQFTSAGAFVAKFGTVGPGPGQLGDAFNGGAGDQPWRLTVGSDGIVYMSDGSFGGTQPPWSTIERYDSVAGEFLAPFDVAALTGGEPFHTTVGLEVDPDTGNLLVARADPNVSILEFDVSGGPVTHVDTHMVNSGLVPNGIGINPETDQLFVSSASSPGHRVYVLDADGAGDPDVTINTPTDVGPHSATLSATVNPEGFPSSYRFEYSKDGVSWTPVKPDEEIGSGTDDVFVSDVADGLEANALYQVRVVVTKGFGAGAGISDSVTFMTHRAPPAVVALPPDRQATSAFLGARVNPNNLETTYQIEYGLTPAYGSSVPVPAASAGSAGVPVTVSQLVTGLAPETVYHFRVVATNDEGTTEGDSQTFTTRSASAGGDAARAFERVSPPSVGGAGVGSWYNGIGAASSTGTGAHRGERFAVKGFYGAMVADGGMAWAHDFALAERTPAGWLSRAAMTHPAHGNASHRMLNMRAASADLDTYTLNSNGGILKMFPEMEAWPANNDPTFVGSWQARWELFSLSDPSQLEAGLGTSQDKSETVVSADGSTVVGMGSYHGVMGPEDPTNMSWPDRIAGRTVYLMDVSAGLSDRFVGNGRRSLVNACTAGTIVPERLSSGVLEGRACGNRLAGRSARLVSNRGAALHAGGVSEQDPVRSSMKNMVSRDGARVFFLSPDPAGAPPAAGCTGTGASTSCPPQLYVRQRNSDASISTRWISGATPDVFGGQDAALMGPAIFEGASVDGDRVFFRTNSPLTADDPNGGVSDRPSNDSWDLYMYELPGGPDSDPTTPDGDPAGGTLTRVSRGPTGDSDCNSPHGGAIQGSTGNSAALRFVSDDGRRLYFTCAAPLDGVGDGDNGTITSPGGAVSASTATNLYVYEHGGGSESWRFVARLPRATGSAVAACASTGPYQRSGLWENSVLRGRVGMAGNMGANCVRGTADGEFVTFWTDGQLTADDLDSATGDVYGYDVRDGGDLVRISRAQSGDGAPYRCSQETPVADCYGDPGFGHAGREPLAMLGVVSEPPVAGQRTAFFQSRSRLVADDTDDAYDVYQWRDGRLSLISTGASGTDGAFYKGNSADGRNVYFATRDRLSWQDADAVLDVYTARVGGGIPEPVPAPVCAVLAGGCHGGGALPVPAPTATTAPAARGDAVSRRHSLAVGRVGAKARRRAARTGRLSIRVRTGRAGVIRVGARARLGRRSVKVASARKRTAKPGVTRVRVRLNRRARKALQRGRTLRVTLRVAQSGARTRTVTVSLKRGKRS